MWLIKHRPTNLTIHRWARRRTCAAYMPLACSCEGVSGLSSQRSLMLPDPGRRLDGITGNWIVFHLLWKQPGRDTPSPPPTIPAASTPPPSHVHPSSHPIMKACCTKPLLLHVIQSFPLRCRNAGLYVSRVLDKAAACTMAAGEIQHCSASP